LAPATVSRSAREDCQDGSGEHHQEPDNADHRNPDQAVREYDTSDEEEQAHRKQRNTLDPAALGKAAHPGAPDVRRELGVLCIERALDLIEQTLLVLGEWHGSSSGTPP
jgi:hypothetical protein